LEISLFPKIYTGVGLLDTMVVLFLVFFFLKKPKYCFLWWLHQFEFPPAGCKSSFFPTSSPTFVICRLLEDSHSVRCEVTPHCGFDLCFSND